MCFHVATLLVMQKLADCQPLSAATLHSCRVNGNSRMSIVRVRSKKSCVFRYPEDTLVGCCFLLVDGRLFGGSPEVVKFLRKVEKPQWNDYVDHYEHQKIHSKEVKWSYLFLDFEEGRT